MNSDDSIDKSSIAGLVAFFIFMVLFSIVPAQDIVEETRIVRSNNTGSMYPTVVPGTEYQVVNYTGGVLECGRIYVYEKGEKLVGHRFVYESDGEYFFKGDSNPTIDQLPVSKEQIKYRVVGYSYE